LEANILDPEDQAVADNVETYGFHSVGVFAEGDDPAFRYSVGFWESLESLPLDLMHNMIWEIFRQLKTGKRLQDGERWSDLIEGFDCVSRPVHPTQMNEYFGVGLWYRRYRTRRRDGLCAFQLFWPGKLQGLYPWEEGCNSAVRDHQPALYLPQAVGIA
jgi:hypothetical protein